MPPYNLYPRQVHREDTPTGLELGPPASPTLTCQTDSSEFDKYKNFPMEPEEMYARIDKLKGFRRPGTTKEEKSKKKKWSLKKKADKALVEENYSPEKEGLKDVTPEEVVEDRVAAGAGLRKAFSSVINLLSQSQVRLLKA